MKNSLSPRLWPLLIAVFLLAHGCAEPTHPVAAPRVIDKFHSGSLNMSIKKGVPRVIYIDLRDAAGPRSVTPPEIAAAIAHENFKITDSPSKAGYILHINIIKEDTVNPEIFPDVVRSGYGGPAEFSGSGAKALLADIILVQRQVPAAKRPSHERLKSIAARNALDSGQMRVGLMLAGDDAAKPEYERLFYSALAEELQNALSPHGAD